VELTDKTPLNIWIDWLLSVHPKEIDLGLARVSKVAKTMGLLNPKPFVISVAGTNGKGSSVAMLSSIYRAEGYNVGCYTSPHVLVFNERFQVNGRLATDLEITKAFFDIEQARQKNDNIKLTYFEFSTLAALVIFESQDLDVIILEVGLGGRLDAVNIIDADVSLITAIDVDHIEWLGSDRELIGVEKAGIMRKDKLSICSDPNAPESISAYAESNSVNLVDAKDDFSFKLNKDSWDFKYNDEVLKYLPFPNLQGKFQIQNAAGVIALILSTKLAVSLDAIKKGLQKVQHSGRLERFYVEGKAWLADVAHNVQAMGMLAEYLQQIKFSGNIIFSVLNDKNYTKMVSKIKPFISSWYIADLNVDRSSSISVLEKTLLDLGVKTSQIHKFPSIELATQFLIKENKHDVLVSGSFFTVSQCYNSLLKQGINIK